MRKSTHIQIQIDIHYIFSYTIDKIGVSLDYTGFATMYYLFSFVNKKKYQVFIMAKFLFGKVVFEDFL